MPREIEHSLRQYKAPPPVPIHRMDDQTRGITKHMIHEEAHRREPEGEWAGKKIMLPILNTRDHEKTLHAAEALTYDDIKIQKAQYSKSLTAREEQTEYERMSTGKDYRHMIAIQNAVKMGRSKAKEERRRDRQKRKEEALLRNEAEDEIVGVIEKVAERMCDGA